MALEKSILTMDSMSTLFLSDYGLHLIEYQPMNLGSANCFCVRCEEGEYFCKEFQSKITLEAVEKEAAVVSYLRSRDFPTAGFIQTKDGRSCLLHEGHVICVQEFVDGKTHLNDLPHSILTKEAACLGRLHTLLKDCPVPLQRDMDEAWADSISMENEKQKYMELLEYHWDQGILSPKAVRIRRDILFRIDLMDIVGKYKPYFRGITYAPSHGDFTACQLILDGDQIKAVIDFSSAAVIPIVWEIMRSYIQSRGSFDTEDFVMYVREYMKEASLTRRDLEAMPYVYLFQLARSRYGYKEYLSRKAENADALLDFAFWRTDVLRTIIMKAQSISDACVAILDDPKT